MYSKKQFAALELMCRERAALAKKEMEYSLMEYWLAEAEEWKQLRDSLDPFIGRLVPLKCPSEVEQRPSSNDTRGKMIAGASPLCEM